MSDWPQYDVFLAHNSQDKPQVRAVAKELRQRGVNFWLDEDVIAPAMEYERNWEKHEELSQVLNDVRLLLIEYAKLLL